MNDIAGEVQICASLLNQWQLLSGTWNSGSSSSVVIRLVTDGNPNGSIYFDDIALSPPSATATPTRAHAPRPRPPPGRAPRQPGHPRQPPRRRHPQARPAASWTTRSTTAAAARISLSSRASRAAATPSRPATISSTTLSCSTTSAAWAGSTSTTPTAAPSAAHRAGPTRTALPATPRPTSRRRRSTPGTIASWRCLARWWARPPRSGRWPARTTATS